MGDVRHARRQPEQFAVLARKLFGAMSTGGQIGFEDVEWFNGGLFEDDEALPMDEAQIATTLKAAALYWSSIDPSILGTLFECGLDPGKRSRARTTQIGTRSCGSCARIKTSRHSRKPLWFDVPNHVHDHGIEQAPALSNALQVALHDH